MESVQLKQLRLALAFRRQALVEELRGDQERAHSEPPGVLAEVSLAELSRDAIELREVEAALTRLEDGAYGICADCGGGIGFERLRAEPEAARCIDCQSRHEKT